MKKSLIHALKGFLVGLCDLVPGISGGTMAFLLGIYQRLITVIRDLDHNLLCFWRKRRFKKAIKKLDLEFTIPFGLGVVAAIIILARLMDALLTTYPIHTYAFFFGLIVASTVILATHIRKWTAKRSFTLFVGAIIGITLSILGTIQFGHSPLILFLSGLVASAAMLLPGVSGSYILLVLNQYEYVTSAIRAYDFTTIGIVGAGIILGLYLMSHVIGYLLEHKHQLTIFFLLGIVLGSLVLFIRKIGANWTIVVTFWFVVGVVVPLIVSHLAEKRRR